MAFVVGSRPEGGMLCQLCVHHALIVHSLTFISILIAVCIIRSCLRVWVTHVWSHIGLECQHCSHSWCCHRSFILPICVYQSTFEKDLAFLIFSILRKTFRSMNRNQIWIWTSCFIRPTLLNFILHELRAQSEPSCLIIELNEFLYILRSLYPNILGYSLLTTFLKSIVCNSYFIQDFIIVLQVLGQVSLQVLVVWYQFFEWFHLYPARLLGYGATFVILMVWFKVIWFLLFAIENASSILVCEKTGFALFILYHRSDAWFSLKSHSLFLLHQWSFWNWSILGALSSSKSLLLHVLWLESPNFNFSIYLAYKYAIKISLSLLFLHFERVIFLRKEFIKYFQVSWFNNSLLFYFHDSRFCNLFQHFFAVIFCHSYSLGFKLKFPFSLLTLRADLLVCLFARCAWSCSVVETTTIWWFGFYPLQGFLWSSNHVWRTSAKSSIPEEQILPASDSMQFLQTAFFVTNIADHLNFGGVSCLSLIHIVCFSRHIHLQRSDFSRFGLELHSLSFCG